MGGGFLQLAAYGAQDLYLTGNPQISYFIMVYKRYTNFAIENCRQYFTGQADFGKKVYCQIERIGDLMSQTFLVVNLPSLKPYFTEDKKYYWRNAIGHCLIDTVEIEIGGKIIDRHYGVWLQIWIELSLPAGKYSAYKKLVGFSDDKCYFDFEDKFKAYIPLQFWFCRNIGLSLPLIALQNHEVRINVLFRNINELLVLKEGDKECGIVDINTNQINIESAYLYVDYIFLEDSERKKFAQRNHEYLIEQLQLDSSDLYSGGRKNNQFFDFDSNDINLSDNLVECTSTNTNTPDCATTLVEHKVELNFNHPVIELIWVIQNTDNLLLNDKNNFNGSQILNFGIESCCKRNDTLLRLMEIERNHPMLNATFYIEGKERLEERDFKYFNIIQPYQRHRNVPLDWIYNYSFSLDPENTRPSGACNFSRIDSSHFIFNLNSKITNPRLLMFARNYNILKIKAGMAGIAYSN
jgi:hypothetical protein